MFTKLISGTLPLLLICFAIVPAEADIVWEFDSNDGANKSVTGRFTTTGDQVDLQDANTFNLISIDSVTITNLATFGVIELNTGSLWKGGVAPPFTASPSGSINWDPVTMNVTQNQNFLLANAGGSSASQIGIGNSDGVSGNTTFVAYFPDPNPAIFTPWISLNPTLGNSTITPVAVPEPSALIALFGVTVFGLSRRHRQRV